MAKTGATVRARRFDPTALVWMMSAILLLALIIAPMYFLVRKVSCSPRSRVEKLQSWQFRRGLHESALSRPVLDPGHLRLGQHLA
jgi:hypothetical protein